MIKTGGNLVRKYRAAPRQTTGPRDVPLGQLMREIENGSKRFWEKRGGEPVAGSFGDTFKFGNKEKTA